MRSRPPLRPPQDFVVVPHAHLQQMRQQRPHFRDGHLRLFFPPTAASGAPRTPTPTATTPCDGASRPSHASRTRPGHTPPCHTGCLPRSSSDCHAPAPASPTTRAAGALRGGTSTPPTAPANAAPTNARAVPATRPHTTTRPPQRIRTFAAPDCLRPRRRVARPSPEGPPRSRPRVAARRPPTAWWVDGHAADAAALPPG